MNGKTIAIIFGVGVALLLLWSSISNASPGNRGVSSNPFKNEINGGINPPVVPNATYARDFQTGSRLGEFVSGVFSGWGKKSLPDDTYDSDYVDSLPR